MLPVPKFLRLTSAVVTSIHVRTRVGFSVRDERRSGNGPKNKVEKRRREKTEVFEVSREARTVLPDKAAVNEIVEGRGARRAIGGEIEGGEGGKEASRNGMFRRRGKRAEGGLGRRELVVGIER